MIRSAPPLKRQYLEVLLHALLCLLLFALHPALASEGSTNSLPGYAGYSGLWDMPNARVLPDWKMRLGYSLSYPYYYFHTTVGLFDRLEVNGRVTGIRGVPALEEDYGDYKDKSLDIKLVLLKESGRLPALALGANDIHGTGLFSARYIALSKRIGAVDITWGLVQGMLGGKSASERLEEIPEGSDDPGFAYLFSRDTDFVGYWGIEWNLNERLSLAVEYSPIDWEEVNGGNEAESNITFGLKYTLWEHLHLSLSYARGEELSGGVVVEFPLEPEGLLTWKREPKPIRQEKLLLQAAEADDGELARLLVSVLEKDGFIKAGVMASTPRLWVEIENTKYNSSGLAFRRLFEIVDEIAPERFTRLYFALIRDGVFQTGLAVSRGGMRHYVKSKIDTVGFLEFAELTHEREELWSGFNPEGATIMPARSRPKGWSLTLEPRLDSFVNDPSGFFKTAFSLDLAGTVKPWPGGMWAARFSVPLYNDVSTSNEVEEPEPASTDIVDYLGRKSPHLTAYGYDHIFELPSAVRARLGVGAFEAAFAGFGAEVFRYFGDGRFGLGLQGERVWKRDVDNDFRLDEDNETPYYTYFLNLYGQPFGRSGVEVGLRLGRFLGGDDGARFEICRTFKHFTIGAWYSSTDTSGFESSYNRGYHDKGVFISFPFSSFRDGPVRGRYHYSIAPWTRDPGQMVSQFRMLYPLGSEPETIWSVADSIWEARR